MKQLLFALLMLLSIAAAGQQKDLKAEINQTAFDKIINSVSYPYMVYEYKDPFRGSFIETAPMGTMDIAGDAAGDDKNYTPDEIKGLFKWAMENTMIASMQGTKEEEVFRAALKGVWENFRREIQDMVNSNSGAKEMPKEQGGNYTLEDLKKWNGYTTVDQLFDEIQKSETAMMKSGFDAKAHLAYARVDVLQAPKMIINNPAFDVNGIRVKATATGELWVKTPHLVCCRWFGPICICFRIEWRWHRIASLTVAPQIGADITINFAINGLKIFAGGQFRKLFLDYPILREINFAGIVNRGIANKKFELYDVSKFVASVPYINRKFRISEITLPASAGSVIVQVNVTQTN